MDLNCSSDSQTVIDIVDKLKKQGLFDKFRKDCLADVDTKPAYQNLRHRVENAVNRFLSKHDFKPGMNINLGRENVRKHIQESQMLATGVDLIIEQVVNPRVFSVFKPAVDKVVCEHLNIDQAEWEEKLRYRDDMKRREEEGDMADEGGIPNLLDLPTNHRGNMMNSNQGGRQTDLLSPPTMYQQQAGVYGNYNDFNAQQYPGVSGFPFPNQFQNQTNLLGMPNFGMLGAQLGTETVQTTESPQLEVGDSQESTETKDKKKEKKKKLAPLTVEDLLNIPLPKEQDKKMTKDKDEMRDDLGVEVGGEYEAVETVVVSEEQPYATDENIVTEGQFDAGGEHEIITTEEIQTEVVHDEEQPKVYHFAWQDLAEDAASDVTVSSVHTSDLSDFDDDATVHSSSVKGDDAYMEFTSDEDVTQEPDDDETGDVEEVTSPEKAKPQKLISLQYNISDSENEETREERKERIAKEREFRTMRRQQRRVEIDAKRAKLLEERALHREARKQALLAKKQREAKLKREQQQEIEKTQVEKDEKTENKEKEDGEKAEERAQASPKPSPNKKTPTTPRKQKKSKEELKQEIREQKVMEKRMALRRKRTINPKYLSEDFESVFTSKKDLLSDDYVVMEEGDVVMETSEVVQEVPTHQYTQEVSVNLENLKLPSDDHQQFILTTMEDGQQVLVDNSGDVVYQVTDGTATADGTIGSSDGTPGVQYVEVPHMTRSKTRERHGDDSQDIPLPLDPAPKRGADIPSSCAATPVDTPGSRAATPYSDVSDLSQSSDSKRGRAGRKKHDPSEVEDKEAAESKKPVEQTTKSTLDNQRYDEDDLYKPRLSLRHRKRGRSLSPPAEPDVDLTKVELETPLSPVRSPSSSPCEVASPQSPSIDGPLSPTRSPSRSPSRSPCEVASPQSPGRDGPQSPGRDGPQSPSRDGPQSPGRDGPQSPSRDGPQSPSRDGPQSPSRDGPQSPSGDGPQSPDRESPVPARRIKRRRTSDDTRSTVSSHYRSRKSRKEGRRSESSSRSSFSKPISIRSRSTSISRSYSSRSRSRSRSYSRSRSRSSSKSRSRSDSRSRSRSRSESKPRSVTKRRREHSVSDVSEALSGKEKESGEDSNDDRKTRPKRSLDNVNFGEAGRRAYKGYAEEAPFPPGPMAAGPINPRGRGYGPPPQGPPMRGGPPPRGGFRPYGQAVPYAPRGTRAYPPRGRAVAPYSSRGPRPTAPWSGYPQDDRGRGRGYYKYDSYYEGSERVSSPDARYRAKPVASAEGPKLSRGYPAPEYDGESVHRKRGPPPDVEDIPRKRYRETSPSPQRSMRTHSPSGPPTRPPVRGGPISPSSDPDIGYRRGPPPPRRAPPPPPAPIRGRSRIASPGYGPPPPGPPPGISSPRPETRTMRRVSEEHNAPISKRLRKT